MPPFIYYILLPKGPGGWSRVTFSNLPIILLLTALVFKIVKNIQLSSFYVIWGEAKNPPLAVI